MTPQEQADALAASSAWDDATRAAEYQANQAARLSSMVWGPGAATPPLSQAFVQAIPGPPPAGDPTVDNFVAQMYPPGMNGSPSVNEAFARALGIDVALGMPPVPATAAPPPPPTNADLWNQTLRDIQSGRLMNAPQKPPPWALFAQGLGDASKSLALGVLSSELPGVEQAANILSESMESVELAPAAGGAAPADAHEGGLQEARGGSGRSDALDARARSRRRAARGRRRAGAGRARRGLRERVQQVDDAVPGGDDADAPDVRPVRAERRARGGRRDGVQRGLQSPLPDSVGAMTAADDWDQGDYRGAGRAAGTTAFEAGTLTLAAAGAVAGAAPAIRAGVGDFVEGELASRGFFSGSATSEGSAEAQWGGRVGGESASAPIQGGATWRMLGARPDPRVVAQIGDVWCGQASLETLGNRLGFPITQDEATINLTTDEAIAKFGQGVGDGTTAEQLQYVINKTDPGPGEWDTRLVADTPFMDRANDLATC